MTQFPTKYQSVNLIEEVNNLSFINNEPFILEESYLTQQGGLLDQIRTRYTYSSDDQAIE